ncbi:hypothetical protein CDAR_498831 [Caerostris darwini]|uniref:Uncharacterized protein n=1 Tax=Caerostris darwini TaxID=1538125 RepID=A0AAV4SPT4_9ARAC|nr:hypothetical protein CDAR_498831 [Caerostris darwini]
MALQIRCSKGFLWSPLNLERISEAPLVRAAFCFNAGVYYDDESSQNEVCAFNAPFPCTHHALLRILRGRAFSWKKNQPRHSHSAIRPRRFGCILILMFWSINSIRDSPR